MSPLPISEADLLTLCETGVKAALVAGADQAEVYASAAQDMEVTFEKNDLNMMRTVSETTFGIRVFVQGRLGFATSNRPEDLQEIAAEAVGLAKISPADPDQGLPEPLPLPDPAPQVDPDILGMDPETLTQFGMEIVEEIRSRDPRITIDTGEISVGEGIEAIVTSQGICASYHATDASGSLFGMAIDGDEVGSFAYDGDEVSRWSDLRPALAVAFERFVQKCVGALGARPGESFRGPILIPADSVDDFLGDLLAVLGADMVRKGKSPLGGRLGEQIASPLLTVVEAGMGLPGHPLTPFDREGLPRQRLPLLEQGVLRHFLTNSYEARLLGQVSTGHAQGGAGMLPVIGPACVSVEPGDVPLATLMQMDPGIIVTRFSGSSNPISGDFSGVVKGGFLVKGGEKIPIQETTVAGNLYECLQRISGISQEVQVFGGTASYPAIRIEDVSITAG